MLGWQSRDAEDLSPGHGHEHEHEHGHEHGREPLPGPLSPPCRAPPHGPAAALGAGRWALGAGCRVLGAGCGAEVPRRGCSMAEVPAAPHRTTGSTLLHPLSALLGIPLDQVSCSPPGGTGWGAGVSRAGLGWAICRAVQPPRGELEALVAGFAGCLGGKLLFFRQRPGRSPWC